ncbi:s1 RNA binding domain protein [Streptococcus pneumoniae]|nr:s1 RNA binding domain protein [Streptococcus pneumoniae]
MNTNLASFIVGLIIDENDRFYFVQKDGQTYALAKEEGQHTVGDTVKGFAYTDMKQKLRLTTLEVTATQDQFGWGRVTEVRKDLGVFVDTGLPDKEIVVSLDILPELKELWPKKGDQLYIRLEVDKKDRIWGLLAYQEDFQRLLVLPTTTCRTKTGQPLFTVSSCQELLFTYQKIICLVLFILASVTQSHVWGKY